MTTDIDIQPKVINAATDIMMDKFIDILVDGKIGLLTLEGIPSPTQLMQAWDKIQNEYADAMGEESHGELLKILQDINILNWQQSRVITLVQVLSVYYISSAVQELKKMGYKIRYDPDNLQQYYHDLQNALEKSKTLQIKAQIRQKDLDAYQEKKRGVVNSRGDYQAMFISISEFSKYQVLPSQISAFQFAVMTRRRNEYAKEMDKRLNKQKGGPRGN